MINNYHFLIFLIFSFFTLKGDSMTQRQKFYHAQLVTKVHLTPMYHNVYRNDRELYESFLINTFGVESSKMLSISELKSLISYFEGETRVLNVDKKGRPTKEGMASTAQIAKIQALWHQKARDKSDTALRNFIKRQTGEFPLHLSKLTKKEATMILIALERMK